MVARQKYTQANRRLAISTPLGEDVLLLRSLNGSDGVSKLFHFNLELSSEDDSLNFDDLVGKRVTARIRLADGTDRHWNGIVSRFSQGRRDGNLTAYHAEMVPWLWFLTRTADCRIFQHKKVPDILRQIFQDLNFQDFEFRLYSDYAERDYCVQYRETDFNFISRLMEEEGIYYFFEHDKEKHKLIIADDASAHKPCPGQAKARCEESAGGWQDDDVIREWRQEQELRPGSWAQTDYNFETPSTDLMVSVAGANPYEIYDYPGEYGDRGEGDSLAKIRLQQETVSQLMGHGMSECRAFVPGFTFKLEDHYRSDLNTEYLLTSVQHRASQGGDYSSGPIESNDQDFSYENRFECIPASIQFRPRRMTPRPTVYGCQTAVVVGPPGEEIYTDKYGRVKVQFHWDREGKRNENSSCWVRVSQPWAGQGWGAVSIPRLGQEVVINFIEGNPDDPIIVGRVYNAECMPPYGLPGGGMVSGFKSNSTKGGGGYNEISANDTKGNELITIHGQYDMDTNVKHDERVTIGNNRTEKVTVDESITIGNNRTESVGVNEDIKIGANRTEAVGANESISVTGSRTRSVGVNETVSVGALRTHTVGINEAITVGAAQEVTIGGLQMVSVGAIQLITVGASQRTTVGTSQNISVGASQNTTVGANLASKVSGNRTDKTGGNAKQSIGGNHAAKVGGKRATKVGSKDTLSVGSKLTIDAGSQIVLKSGSSSITLKSGGTIVLKGTKVVVDATSKFSAKAAQISSEAKAKNTVKGAMVTVNASGINTVKGSLVKIN